jgi:excinuclease UvrABC nuclease subunit
MLKLFLLRRCDENLDPHPSHPGCVYSEMKMCLAPCFKGCTDERYAEEAEGVRSFLATRGESRLTPIRFDRDRASEELEFEKAAALHALFQRVEGVRALAPELVRPMSELRACFLQASANPEEVSMFLYLDGELRGPAAFSTLGMRIQNEQSGSSSLFAQPLSVQAVPEAGSPAAAKAARDVLEARMEAALEALSGGRPLPGSIIRQAHLALVTRWYYRPQQKRVGEIFFADGDGRWPVRALLRGAGRVVAAGFKPAVAAPAAASAAGPGS